MPLSVWIRLLRCIHCCVQVHIYADVLLCLVMWVYECVGNSMSVCVRVCMYALKKKKDQASQTPGENCSFIRWSHLRDGLDPTIVLKNTIDRFWVSYCWYNRIDPSIEIDWPQRKETFIHLRLIDHKRINTPYLESGRMNGLIGTIFFWGESPRRTVDVDLVSL